jgi:hypothetical protein
LIDRIKAAVRGFSKKQRFARARATSCSFCRTQTVDVAEGPEVSICKRCVDAASGSRANVDVAGVCSFCRKERVTALVDAAGNTRICVGCIEIARQVIEHERAKNDVTPA